MTTWQTSFDYIHLHRQSATELLSLMSFFDGQGIPESLVRPSDENKIHNHEANVDNDSVNSHEDADDVFEEDISILRDYCLIGTNEDDNIFEMHRLVQLSTRAWLSTHRKSEKFKKQYISRMAQAFPEGKFENWETCRRLFPHVQKAVDYRPDDEKSLEEWALLMFNGSWYSEEQGRYATAETMARKSLDTRRTVLGAEDHDTLKSMARLASTYWFQGRWSEAETLEVQVLEAHKTILGTDHPDTLRSMASLALTYSEQGRWPEAETLEKQVLEACRTILGTDHPDTLTSMSNLAFTWESQGHIIKAIQLMKDCISISGHVLGLDHPVTIERVSALNTWQDQDRMDE